MKRILAILVILSLAGGGGFLLAGVLRSGRAANGHSYVTLSSSRAESGEAAPAAQAQVRLTTAAEAAPSLPDEGQTEVREAAAGSQKAEDNVSEEEAAGPVTLLFAGDIYLSDYVLQAYDQAGGISGVLDEGIREEIRQADLFMANMEFPFTERGTKAADKQYTFRLPESRFRILEETGVDIVTLANNHILDYGEQGLSDSLDLLEAKGLPAVGAGRDLEQASALQILEVKGKKIGFLGTSRVYMSADWAAGPGHPGVFSTYDTTLPLQKIREAREKCDFLVVYVHWGVERETSPQDYQVRMGQDYIRAGADLVVGAHPHVLQPVVSWQGKTIAYSLGNFIFGSSIPETELLKITLQEDGSYQTDTIPCKASGGYTRLR